LDAPQGAMEDFMLKHARTFAAGSLIAFCMPLTPGQAQTGGSPAAVGGLDCGGQYECIEFEPLSAQQARTSRGYPQARPEGATRPAEEATDASADERARRDLARRPNGTQRELH
jgi:hypothetical protein